MGSSVTTTYLGKHTKEGDPQNEENQVPARDDETTGALDGGDEVDNGSHSGQGSDDDGIGLQTG